MARWWIERPSSFAGDCEYYVQVCSFTFSFASLHHLREALAFYEQKILPSSRLPGPIPGSRWGDHEECQRWYERLPLRLREESKRKRVIQAMVRSTTHLLGSGRNVDGAGLSPFSCSLWVRLLFALGIVRALIVSILHRIWMSIQRMKFPP